MKTEIVTITFILLLAEFERQTRLLTEIECQSEE
jgi:hypothetical protein